MIDQDRPRIGLLELANDIRPVLHRVLYIRDASHFELAVLFDRLLSAFRDGLTIRDLLLDDMDLAVLGLPTTLFFRVLQPERKGPTVIHFRRDRLEHMSIFFGICLDRLCRHSVRRTMQEGTFVLR